MAHHDVMSRFSLRVGRGSEWPDGVVRPDRDGDPGTASAGVGGDKERQLVVVVDGVAELYRWDGMGLDPNDVLNPELPWLPSADGTGVDRVVQRCGCGIIGCGALTMTIRRVGDTVVWTDAREGERRYDIGPFRFDADQYETALRRAHHERPWESRDETVARLVAEAFRSQRCARPRSFDWASANFSAGHVVVSMTDFHPNPRAGDPIGQAHTDDGGSWQAIEMDELSHQHLGLFDIPDDVTAEQAAATIIERVRTENPRPGLARNSATDDPASGRSRPRSGTSEAPFPRHSRRS